MTVIETLPASSDVVGQRHAIFAIGSGLTGLAATKTLKLAQMNITDALASSPLSQSNWDNRIVVPLEFQPVDEPCPLGAPERPLIGHGIRREGGAGPPGPPSFRPDLPDDFPVRLGQQPSTLGFPDVDTFRDLDFTITAVPGSLRESGDPPQGPR